MAREANINGGSRNFSGRLSVNYWCTRLHFDVMGHGKIDTSGLEIKRRESPQWAYHIYF